MVRDLFHAMNFALKRLCFELKLLCIYFHGLYYCDNGLSNLFIGSTIMLVTCYHSGTFSGKLVGDKKCVFYEKICFPPMVTIHKQTLLVDYG